MVRADECAFSPPFGQYLADNIEGVEAFCRTFVLEATLKSDYNLLKSPNCFYADSNFFSMFTFPLVKGDARSVLTVRNSVVLSESFAQRLFPNQDPIGKTVRFNNRLDYFVTGIAKDFDENTHFKPADAIFPFIALADFLDNQQYLLQYDLRFFLPSLYVMANDGIDLSSKGGEVYDMAKSWYWLFQEDDSKNVEFQSLEKVYLDAARYGFPSGARTGNSQLLSLFTLIVFGILVIATVNFINLTVSYSVKRQNEFGIKKIIGAKQVQVFFQSLLETAILVTVSLLVAIAFLPIVLNVFSQLTGYHTTISLFFETIHWLQFLIGILLFYLISALIPAFIASKPQSLLVKYAVSKQAKIGYMQNALVIFQFVISLVLIVSMITIQKQNHFLKTFNVGFNKEELLFIKLNSEIKGKKLQFKEELKKIAGVEGVSLCNGMPGVGISDLRFEANNKTQSIDFLNIDVDYFNVMGIKVNNQSLMGEDDCFINESAAQSLGYNSNDKIIEIDQYGTQQIYKVKEVLPDMNFHSLYQAPRPVIFTKINTEGWVDYALVRIDPSNLVHLLKQMESTYKRFSSSFPFDFAFLNDQINRAYVRETQTEKIVKWFSVFAILISSLGLFAMAVFSSDKRTKEIGIRKVNGARISEVLIMLNKDFVKWVAIAFVIASPIAWYAMQKWLQNFAYKTELSWWIFALAGLLALGVALLTVSWQSWKAATRNPVEALRDE